MLSKTILFKCLYRQLSPSVTRQQQQKTNEIPTCLRLRYFSKSCLVLKNGANYNWHQEDNYQIYILLFHTTVMASQPDHYMSTNEANYMDLAP